MSLIDRMAFLLSADAPFIFAYRNEHLITELAAAGKGVILLNSHMGNWEIAGSLLVDRIKTPLNAVMLDAERDEMRRIYRAAFEQRRFNTIPVTADGLETSLLSLQCLRRGELLSLAGDRVLDQQSEILEFLDGPARFARGPFALAALTGASIIPVFTFKTGPRHYVFEACKPIVFDTVQRSTRNEQIKDKMKEYVAVLEEAAREHPYQWYNFFEFWAL
jgi:predicted LPLAT superfamily acyltransferase